MILGSNLYPARRLLTAWGLVLALAQTALGASSSWSLRTWESDDGLPNNTVNGVAQTRDGYLYVATPNRLARFDGISFEEFPRRNFGGAFNHKLRLLMTDRKGELCIAMEGELAVLGAGASRAFTNNLANLIPQCLVEDGEGAFWMVYARSKVCRVNNGEVTRYGAGDGLNDNTCTLAVDQSGRVWFGQGHSVGIFRDGRFVELVRAPNLMTRVAAARDGGIWIFSGAELLKYHEGGRAESRARLEIEPPYRTATALLETRDGAVWVGTFDHGLFRCDGDGFEAVPTSHPYIQDLMEDREGDVWVSTEGGGLNRLEPRGIELLQSDSGLPFDAVESICEDKAGLLWVATQNGVLACQTSAGWRNISSETNWPGGRATCVAAAPDGGVWIGTANRSLRRWRNGRIEIVAQTERASHVIHALFVTRNGDLWIGGNGLQCYHEGRIQDILLPAGKRLIRAMAEDQAGDVWIGTAAGELLCVSNGVATDMIPRTKDEPKSIRCLLATPDGCLWIGYAGAGVGRLKDGKYYRVRTDQGLYDSGISQMAYDRGWLWFGANHGIFKVREEELNALAESNSVQIYSVHYGRDDGAVSLQANVGNFPSSVRDREGRLWLPMRNGLAVVDMKKLREQTKPPAVLLKSVAVDDRAIAVYGGVIPVHDVASLERGTTLSIGPGARRLEFQFTALSFRAPEDVRFRYRLGGLDDSWVDAGSQRSVTFPELPAGHYLFQVKAGNRDGVWNETGADVAFAIAPFFWQTWWFRIAIVAGCIFATGATVRYVSLRRLRRRVEALEQQAALDRERARIARDIHDDLGASLTQMTLLTELASRGESGPEEVATRLKRLSATVRQVTDSLDETVWAVNPRNDTLAHLVGYVGKFASGFLRTAGIRCLLELPERPPPCAVSAEARHNLFLVVKEALNNCVRHAHATEVTFAISVDESSVKITVSDNGRGFERPQGDDDADGLQNMRERMKSIGGTFQIESRSGNGTRITLNWPLPGGIKVNGKAHEVNI